MPSTGRGSDQPLLAAPLQSLLAYGPAVALIGSEGEIAEANPAFAALFGVPRAALCGRPVAEGLAPDALDAWERLRAAARAQTGAGQRAELALAGGGTARWVEATATALPGTEGASSILLALHDISAHREAERAFARARALWDEAQRLGGVGCWEWDVARDAVTWTDELYRIFGVDPRPGAMKASEFLELVHPEDRMSLWATVKRALADHQPYAVEHRVVRADGTVRYLAGRGQVEVAGGGPARLFGITQDVTETVHANARRQLLADAAAVLAGSLDYLATLQRLVDLAAAGFADFCALFVRDENGVTRRIEANYADPRKNAIAADLLHLPQNLDAPVGVASVFRSGRSERFPELPPGFWEALSPDPHAIAVRAGLGMRSLIYVPVRARGQLFGVLSFGSAESGRRYTEEDLVFAEQFAERAALAIDTARLFRDAQASEARYRAVFDGVAEAIVVLDAEGRIAEANPGVCELVGRPREALLGAAFAGLALDPEVAAGALAALSADGHWQGELRVRHRDGSERDVDVWARRLDASPQPRVVATMRDVTERRLAENLREELVATVSHDLKNPLGAVIANAQILQRWARRDGVVDPERLTRGLDAIESSAGRMTRLIDDLVDVARLHAGEALELTPERVDLVDLARRSLEQYRAMSAAHFVRLEAAVAELCGSWDARRLDRVLANLLTNAVKYSPDGGEIVVAVDREQRDGVEWAMLAVRDRGIGIPPAELPMIFDRFRRGSNVGEIAGTGLGLAGVRHIVERHGGTIVVASEEGRGATFTVRLPLTIAAS